ncbi:MAG: phosphatase PAP2 family protein, partial [Candidatus Zixiibacteriota bacterium]
RRDSARFIRGTREEDKAVVDRTAFYLFDIIILSYLALVAILVLVFGRPLGDYVDELLMNALLAAVVLGIVYFLPAGRSRVALFIRLLYPVILFLFFYEQTGGLMKLFFPDFLDYQLTSFEKSILGVNPTLWLDRNLINVWLTEILMLTYVLYYPMIPSYLIMLFVLRRFDLIKKSLTAICLTFSLSYLLFFLYPIEGPRYYFATRFGREAAGPVFRSLVNYIMVSSAVHGGCMPSSHVAVALVIMIFCLKYFRKIGIVLVPINIGLALSTVYGRFHYVSDVVVGAIIGIGVTILTLHYRPRFDRSGGSAGR